MVIRPVSVPVRMVELSSGGLQLVCPNPARIGATPRVIAGLGGRRLDVKVDIRHVSSKWDEEAGGYLVGGSFPALDSQARQTLDDLLAAAGPSTAGEPLARAGRDRDTARAQGQARRERRDDRREQPQPEPSLWM
jgi:hypothetical protein